MAAPTKQRQAQSPLPRNDLSAPPGPQSVAEPQNPVKQSSGSSKEAEGLLSEMSGSLEGLPEASKHRIQSSAEGSRQEAEESGLPVPESGNVIELNWSGVNHVHERGLNGATSPAAADTGKHVDSTKSHIPTGPGNDCLHAYSKAH